MLAVIKQEALPGLVIGDFAEPETGENEVLIAIKASGICGTDLAIEKWMDWTAQIMGGSLPVIIGHEFGGEVIEAGRSVRDFKPGDRVVAEPFLTCGSCPLCRVGRPNLCMRRLYLGMHRHGGMAQYAVVPESALYKVPQVIPFHYLPLLETLATALHPLERVGIVPGDTLAIVGPGPIGICLLQAARAAGAVNIAMLGMEKDKRRLETAHALGAEITLTVDGGQDARDQVLSATGGLGVDVAVDTTGTQPGALLAMDLVRRGGKVCLVGVSDDALPIKPFSQLMMKEVDLVSSLARLPSTWYRTLRLVEAGRIDLEPLVGERLPLARALAGFEAAREGQSMKVILEP